MTKYNYSTTRSRARLVFVKERYKCSVQGRPQAGARWCTFTALDFALQFFAEHHPRTESDTETPTNSFLEWNTTAGFGVPQVHTRQIYAFQPLTSLWVFTPWIKSCGERAPMKFQLCCKCLAASEFERRNLYCYWPRARRVTNLWFDAELKFLLISV